MLHAALNATGALLTATAAIVFIATKFTSGAWAVVLTVPALMLLFSRIQSYYQAVGLELGPGRLPERPLPAGSLVIVPVGGISKLTERALHAALSLGDEVIAVSVHPKPPKAPPSAPNGIAGTPACGWIPSTAPTGHWPTRSSATPSSAPSPTGSPAANPGPGPWRRRRCRALRLGRRRLLRKVLGGELGERGGERGGMTSTRRLGADDRRDSALFHVVRGSVAGLCDLPWLDVEQAFACRDAGWRARAPHHEAWREVPQWSDGLAG